MMGLVMVSTTGKTSQEAAATAAGVRRFEARTLPTGRPRRLREWAEEMQHPATPVSFLRGTLAVLLLVPWMLSIIFMLSLGLFVFLFNQAPTSHGFNVACIGVSVGVFCFAVPSRGSHKWLLVCAVTAVAFICFAWLFPKFWLPRERDWEYELMAPLTLYVPAAICCASALGAALVFPPKRRNRRLVSTH